MPYHHLSEPLQALKKKTNRSTAAIQSSGWARSPLGAADRVSANPAGAAQLPGPGPARCPEPQRLAGDRPGDTPEPAKGRVPSRAALARAERAAPVLVPRGTRAEAGTPELRPALRDATPLHRERLEGAPAAAEETGRGPATHGDVTRGWHVDARAGWAGGPARRLGGPARPAEVCGPRPPGAGSRAPRARAGMWALPPGSAVAAAAAEDARRSRGPRCPGRRRRPFRLGRRDLRRRSAPPDRGEQRR